jgi:multiple sugar transport system substrate-binding protein
MSDKQRRTTFRSRLDEMVTTLRHEIVTGKRSTGEYLPSELAIAEQFQLSKNSVRKGLDRLVSEGLIVKEPRIGNKVNAPSQEGTVTIQFGYYPSLTKEAEISQLIEDFQKEHPHIRVQTIPLSVDNYYDAVSEHMNNDMLDVMTVNYSDYQMFVEHHSVDKMETFEPNPNVYPFLNDAFANEGSLKVMPFIFSPIVLCYNRNHFSDLNLPEPDSGWTWPKLLEIAAKLVVNGEGERRYGFYFHLLSLNRWPIFLLQSGNKFERDATGKYKIHGTKLIESMLICRNLIYQQGIFPTYLSESDADAEALFLQQKVSMIMTTYFSLNHLRGADFPFDIAPLPYTHEARTLLLVIGLAMNARSGQKQEAKAFIDYLLSKKAQLYVRQKTLSIPSLKPAAEWVGSEEMYRPSRFHMYREIVPTFRLYTDLNLRSADLSAIRNEMKLFWSGLEDEETVSKRLEELL